MDFGLAASKDVADPRDDFHLSGRKSKRKSGTVFTSELHRCFSIIEICSHTS